MKRILRIVVLVYAGLLVVLVMMERLLVYPAPKVNAGSWRANDFDAQDVNFVSSDGTKLHGWFFERESPQAHLLFCHGNGEHLGYLGGWLQQLSRELNVSIFAFDYRGYGKSDGRPFERGILEDGVAAQNWLAKKAACEPEEIVVYGRSLGGAVAVYLASENGCRALIVERTFHSMVQIAADLYPWAPIRFLMRNRFSSVDRIAKFDGPMLQMHGTADQIVPIQSAKWLFDACPSTRKTFLEIPSMGHNDFAPDEFRIAIQDLIDEISDR